MIRRNPQSSFIIPAPSTTLSLGPYYHRMRSLSVFAEFPRIGAGGIADRGDTLFGFH